ncbi:MAG: 30S ribosomal protein S16 [Pelolinea sp.]|nr:30S ribosomal protein S16 [Pelolinea sp.]
MVRIRLRRTGLRNQPSYRIVAADKESPRDGRFLENLGFYNPRTEPSTIEVNEERVFHWLDNGAQPSESVTQIFNSVGVLDRYKKFKDGESMDSLLEEAKTFFESRQVDPKTRMEAPKAK